MRDLGVILDSKLTFADHIDSVVGKANRMLGLLMRSVQMARCARRVTLDQHAIMSAYNAHVRSVIEYGSVIWSGAAVTHLKRLERVQHRFLTWLGRRVQRRCPNMDYVSLLEHFKYQSIKARFSQIDMNFLRSAMVGRLDCHQLTAMFSLAVPARRTRHTGLFHVPGGRVNSVKNSFLSRLPDTCNAMLQDVPEADLFYSPSSFNAHLSTFVRSRGSY